MKKALRFVDDVLAACGVALISVGVFLIYVPAGYITLGSCFVAGAYLFAKSR